MSATNFESVEKAANGAKILASLGPTEIWALIAALLFMLIIWSKWQEIRISKQEQKNQEGWRDIRNNQIASEVAQTEVLKQVIQENINLRMEIAGLKTIVTTYLIGAKNV